MVRAAGNRIKKLVHNLDDPMIVGYCVYLPSWSNMLLL